MFITISTKIDLYMNIGLRTDICGTPADISQYAEELFLKS
jgi:hypothetical protein